MEYISRRRRCWNLLTELDKEIVLSEGHRADLLLDLAGLDKHEKIMIQASIGNSRDFQKVADALILQHPRIHVREHRRHGNKGGRGAGKGYGKKFMTKAYKGCQKRGKGKGSGKSAYIAGEMYDDDWLAEDDYDEPANDAAYVADGTSDESVDEGKEEEEYQEEEGDEFVDTAQEAAELEAIRYLFDLYGFDGDFGYEDVQEAAHKMQEINVAYVGFRKGKGRGKHRGKYPVRPATLSVHDRRAKLADIKSRTYCTDCGKRGHWRGDPQCPVTRSTGAESPGELPTKKRTSRMAIESSPATKENGGYLGDSDEEQPTAHMALKSSSTKKVQFASIARDAVTGHAEDWTDVDVPSINPKFSTGTFRRQIFSENFPTIIFKQLARKAICQKKMQNSRNGLNSTST